MTELVVCSRNKGKLSEIRNLIPNGFVLKGLDDLGFEGEITENGSTFEENALLKAGFIAEKYKLNCLSDDSGLEVDALGGEPGVFSARYAGSGASDQENISKLLQFMEGVSDRKAKFVCCICLIINNKIHFFKGELAGTIALSQKGNQGFGYDPVFIPEGDTRTLAEYTAEEKNRISHRSKAMVDMSTFLASGKLSML